VGIRDAINALLTFLKAGKANFCFNNRHDTKDDGLFFGVFFETAQSWYKKAVDLLSFFLESMRQSTNAAIELVLPNVSVLICISRDAASYFLKKYIYTINHKRIGLNYMYFCMLSGLTGTFLATIIRIELSMPGSHFFKGDSIKYLQVVTSHGLVMVFFVVVPLIFGFFANFFIPLNIGAKDVAFPRLNSFGFWVLFSGYLLFARISFYRKQMYNYYDYDSSLVKLMRVRKKVVNTAKRMRRWARYWSNAWLSKKN